MIRDGEFSYVNFNSEWMEGLELQFHQYMDSMMTAIYEDVDWEGDSGLAFCGCEVCVTREILSFLVPRITRGVTTGFITAKETE